MRRAIFSTLHRANRPITQLVCVEWKREQGKSLLTRSSFETKCPGTEAMLRKFFRPQGSTTTRTNRLTTICVARKVKTPFTMLAPPLTRFVFAGESPTILQFPTEAFRPVYSLRNMTTQLLQEAAQVIPNQQLLINVVSKRVRQLGLGHRPMVETTPRMSLTDIALREIIAGKLTYELTPEKPAGDGAKS